MMNLIARATVGAAVGYCVGSIIDAAANRNSQPKHKAGEYCGSRWYNKVYQLAADQSVSWWQAKMQDSIDVLACGDHAPAERILVTNKEARELRTRFLAGRPRYNEDGGNTVTVSCTFGSSTYKVEDVELSINFMFGFNQVQGSLIPTARIMCHDLDSEKEWASFSEFYNDALEQIQKCKRLGFVSEQRFLEHGKGMYDIGRDIGRSERPAPAPKKKAVKVVPSFEDHKAVGDETDELY